MIELTMDGATFLVNPNRIDAIWVPVFTREEKVQIAVGGVVYKVDEKLAKIIKKLTDAGVSFK
jgi:uncharacterized protein YlzI (FlbEa/FlbD family)